MRKSSYHELRASICLTAQDNILDATKRNDVSQVKHLISNNSLITNQQDQNQWTPLHFTCAYDNESLANVLIQNGAHLDAADKEQRTPLHIACRSSSIGLVKLLIEHQSDVNAKDQYSRTPLHYIFTNEQKDKANVLRLLIANRAQIKQQDMNGETALHLATKIGDIEAMKLLLSEDKSLLQIKDSQQQTPLHKASFVGNLEAIKLLLENGADINEGDKNCRTPLHFVCYHKREPVTLLLLEKNGDLKALDNNKKTPVQLVAERENISLLSLLLDKAQITEYDGICYDSLRPAISAWLIRRSVPGPRTKILRLQDTQLDWLPTEDNFWQGFQELTEVHLEDNQLQSIPTAILTAPQLQQIYFDNNPLLDFPGYAKKDWPTLSKHLHNLRKSAIDWQERKILIVGPSGGGKSAVQRVLAKGRAHRKIFNLTSSTSELSIESGISFRPLYKRLLSRTPNPFVFSIWDLSGTREMFPLHQCFLSSNSIYLLVFDITKWREQLPSIEEWVQQITVSGSNGTRTPIVFVSTHRDSVPYKLVESEQETLYKNIHHRFPQNRFRGIVDDVFLVSCKTREGFPELQELLQQLAGIIQPVGSAQWMRVHEHLQFKKKKKNLKILPIETYIRIAEVHGVTDPTERENMTKFLRSIGTMEYFKDGSLANVVILDCEWLSKQIEDWIRKSPTDKYTLAPEVLQIAQQLGVVFVAKDRNPMIPNTLPASKPENCSAWNDGVLEGIICQTRRYIFGFLPDGLFSRILTRILSLKNVELISIWRYGLIIRQNKQTALITHTPVVYGHQIHEISISVKFPEDMLRNMNGKLNLQQLLIVQLVDISKHFISCYFPHLLKCSTIWIPCAHCVQENSPRPHYFHFSTVLKAKKQNKQYIYCPYPHGGKNKSKALWIPLQIPDFYSSSDTFSTADSQSPWDGPAESLPSVDLLVATVRDAEYHTFKQVYSAALYNRPNQFLELKSEESHPPDKQITCVAAISSSIIWVGYETGAIVIHHISEQNNSISFPKIFHWQAHKGAVTAMVAVSQDKQIRTMWSVGNDGTLRIWDTNTILELRSFSRWHKITQLLVTNNHSTQVRVWGISPEEPYVTVWYPAEESCLCIPLDNFSNFPQSSKIFCIEAHDRYVLVSKGYWIFVICIETLQVLSVWKSMGTSDIIGLKSIHGTNMVLSWSRQCRNIHVWYIVKDGDKIDLEIRELVARSAVVTCSYTRNKKQLNIWTSLQSGEIMIWDACKLEPLFCLVLRTPNHPLFLGTNLLPLGKIFLIVTSMSSDQCCHSLFFKPTAYFFERESLDYNKLATCVHDSPNELFAKYIAPGEGSLDDLERNEYFLSAAQPLIERIICIAKSATNSSLPELLSEAEHCTKYIRALASLISEDGMLAGDLVLPLYIYGVTRAMEKKMYEFSVYQNLVYLQYRYQSFGDDNDACQLTHIIAAAIVTPRLFNIFLPSPDLKKI